MYNGQQIHVMYDTLSDYKENISTSNLRKLQKLLCDNYRYQSFNGMYPLNCLLVWWTKCLYITVVYTVIEGLLHDWWM